MCFALNREESSNQNICGLSLMGYCVVMKQPQVVRVKLSDLRNPTFVTTNHHFQLNFESPRPFSHHCSNRCPLELASNSKWASMSFLSIALAYSIAS